MLFFDDARQDKCKQMSYFIGYLLTLPRVLLLAGSIIVQNESGASKEEFRRIVPSCGRDKLFFSFVSR